MKRSFKIVVQCKLALPSTPAREVPCMGTLRRHSFTATPNALNLAQEEEEKIHPRDGSFPKSGTVFILSGFTLFLFLLLTSGRKTPVRVRLPSGEHVVLKCNPGETADTFKKNAIVKIKVCLPLPWSVSIANNYFLSFTSDHV